MIDWKALDAVFPEPGWDWVREGFVQLGVGALMEFEAERIRRDNTFEGAEDVGKELERLFREQVVETFFERKWLSGLDDVFGGWVKHVTPENLGGKLPALARAFRARWAAAVADNTALEKDALRRVLGEASESPDADGAGGEGESAGLAPPGMGRAWLTQAKALRRWAELHEMRMTPPVGDGKTWSKDVEEICDEIDSRNEVGASGFWRWLAEAQSADDYRVLRDAGAYLRSASLLLSGKWLADPAELPLPEGWVPALLYRHDGAAGLTDDDMKGARPEEAKPLILLKLRETADAALERMRAAWGVAPPAPPAAEPPAPPAPAKPAKAKAAPPAEAPAPPADAPPAEAKRPLSEGTRLLIAKLHHVAQADKQHLAAVEHLKRAWLRLGDAGTADLDQTREAFAPLLRILTEKSGERPYPLKPLLGVTFSAASAQPWAVRLLPKNLNDVTSAYRECDLTLYTAVRRFDESGGPRGVICGVEEFGFSDLQDKVIEKAKVAVTAGKPIAGWDELRKVLRALPSVGKHLANCEKALIVEGPKSSPLTGMPNEFSESLRELYKAVFRSPEFREAMDRAEIEAAWEALLGGWHLVRIPKPPAKVQHDFGDLYETDGPDREPDRIIKAVLYTGWMTKARQAWVKTKVELE